MKWQRVPSQHESWNFDAEWTKLPCNLEQFTAARWLQNRWMLLQDALPLFYLGHLLTSVALLWTCSPYSVAAHKIQMDFVTYFYSQGYLWIHLYLWNCSRQVAVSLNRYSRILPLIEFYDQILGQEFGIIETSRNYAEYQAMGSSRRVYIWQIVWPYGSPWVFAPSCISYVLLPKNSLIWSDIRAVAKLP